MSLVLLDFIVFLLFVFLLSSTFLSSFMHFALFSAFYSSLTVFCLFSMFFSCRTFSACSTTFFCLITWLSLFIIESSTFLSSLFLSAFSVSFSATILSHCSFFPGCFCLSFLSHSPPPPPFFHCVHFSLCCFCLSFLSYSQCPPQFFHFVFFPFVFYVLFACLFFHIHCVRHNSFTFFIFPFVFVCAFFFSIFFSILLCFKLDLTVFSFLLTFSPTILSLFIFLPCFHHHFFPCLLLFSLLHPFFTFTIIIAFNCLFFPFCFLLQDSLTICTSHTHILC